MIARMLSSPEFIIALVSRKSGGESACRTASEVIDHARVEAVSAFYGNHLEARTGTEEREVAHEVQDFVRDDFSGQPQRRERPFVAENERVVEGTAARQAARDQCLDLVQV